MEQKSRKIALVVAIIAGIFLVAVVAIGIIDGIQSGTAEKPEDETEEVISANCSTIECIKKIDVTDSVEKITETIGVEPEYDEFSERYKWKLSNNESIAREKSGDSYILQATINKENVANADVDLSVYNEIKADIQNGKAYTYEDLVKKLGGVEGVVAGKTKNSKRYIWVDKHNQTFSETINNDDGKCSIISLR